MIQKIIDYLEENGRPMNAFDIADGLGAPIEAVDAALKEMIAHGQILLTKKNRYARPDMLGLIPARAMVTRGGARFARPLDGSPDVRISREGDLRAMNGDEILVRPPRRHSPGNAYYLAAITKRAHETLIAVLEEATRTVEQPPVIVRKGRRKKVVHRPPEIVRYVGAVPCDPHLLCAVEVVGVGVGAVSCRSSGSSVAALPYDGTSPRPGVGSNRVHPTPSKYSSGQACRSCEVTSNVSGSPAWRSPGW